MDIYRRFLTLCRTIRRHGTSCIALHSCARQAKEMAHSPSVQKPPHPIRNRGQRPHQTCHSSGRALVIGEIGSTESQGLDCYMRREGSPTRYPPILRDQLFTLCGVFAPTDAFLDQFCSVYLNAVDAVDLLAVWGNSGESNVVAGHAGKAVLIQRFSLEPYTSTIRGRALSLAKPCLSFTLSWRLRFDVALIGAGAILSSPPSSNCAAASGFIPEDQRESYSAFLVAAGRKPVKIACSSPNSKGSNRAVIGSRRASMSAVQHSGVAVAMWRKSSRGADLLMRRMGMRKTKRPHSRQSSLITGVVRP